MKEKFNILKPKMIKHKRKQSTDQTKKKND